MAAGLSLFPAMQTRAYTIDEIVDRCPQMISELKYQKAVYTIGWYYQVNLNINVMKGYGISLEKVDDTHLKFCGFEGKYDFVFTLTDTSGNENANGTQLRIDGMTANTNQDETDNVAYYLYPIISTTYYQGAYNWNREENFVLTITKETSGDFRFNHLASHKNSGRGYFLYKWEDRTPFDCGSVVIDCIIATPAHYAALNKGYQNGYASDRFDNYKYYSSAAASETAPKGARRISSKERTYPVLVKWNDSAKTFSIINFANLGFGYNPTSQDIMTGTFNADGTCTLDKENLYYRLNYGGSYGESGFEGYYATKFVPKSNTVGTAKVTGTWQTVDVRHNPVAHHWVTNGGERRTLEGKEMTFDSYTILNAGGINNKYTNLKFDGGYFDTKLLFGSDVTNDVELVIDDFGTSTTQARVVGHIVTNSNDKYVDHYEVCIVPGKYSSINGDTGFKDPTAEDGHPSAVNLFSTDYDYTSAKEHKVARADASAASHDYTFDKIIDKSEVGSDPSDNYTFFIKTVYTRPDLTPTFHSMKTFEGKTTGIENVGADLDSDAPVEYFNLQGIPVANPGHGVYLRRQGTRTTKVTL